MFGEFGKLTHIAGRVQCHICGGLFNGLGSHARAHGLSADQYRAEFGFNRKTGLASRATILKYRNTAVRNNENPACSFGDFRFLAGPKPWKGRKRPDMRIEGVRNVDRAAQAKTVMVSSPCVVCGEPFTRKSSPMRKICSSECFLDFKRTKAHHMRERRFDRLKNNQDQSIRTIGYSHPVDRDAKGR